MLTYITQVNSRYVLLPLNISNLFLHRLKVASDTTSPTYIANYYQRVSPVGYIATKNYQTNTKLYKDQKLEGVNTTLKIIHNTIHNFPLPKVAHKFNDNKLSVSLIFATDV